MTVESLGAPVEPSHGFEGATLCEAFQATVARHPDAPAVRCWDGSLALTWREYGERVARIAAGLAGLGVTRGETVALMLSNRPEFHVCDTAALHLGATPFSIYNTSAPEQITHLFANARNRVVICESQFLERALAARAGTAVEQVICISGPGERAPAAEGTLTLEQLEADAAEIDVEARWRTVAPDDVLTLIYTSGTTGPPKGVEITHASMLAMISAWTGIMPASPEDRLLSYLPAAHIVDRMTGHYLGMTHGVQLSCVADARSLPAALREVRPTLWIAVPRVWEKLQTALETTIKDEPDEQLRAVTQAGIALGERKVRAEQAAITGNGEGPDSQLLGEYARADELALGRLRAQIGLDQARFCCSGAAPASTGMLEFFGAIGLEICEGWGMTELSGVASINPAGAAKHGTVGPPLPGIEVRLAADGELLCRAATTMRGYRANPTQTAETIGSDGWLHTGDIAQIDEHGYLRIVDRKKELIINSAGLKPGMRVLDVGCGPGDVTFLLSELVGPKGSVVGVERDERAIATARRRADDAGLGNAEFVCGDFRDVQLSGVPFDALVGRFVLMYQADPADAVRRAACHLRPGGVAAFLEANMIGWAVPALGATAATRS